MKTFIKKLIREYFEDDYDLPSFDDLDSFSSKLKKEKEKLKKLPDTIRLYRLILADSANDIDLKKPGSHYSMDKNNLMKKHSFLKGKKYYLIVVDATKNLININVTAENNVNFPSEKEITLKNNGQNAKIVSVTEIK